MPDRPQEPKRAPLALLLGLTCIAIIVVPLNIYNITKHFGESPFWVAAVYLSSILIIVGISLLIWARFAKRY